MEGLTANTVHTSGGSRSVSDEKQLEDNAYLMNDSSVVEQLCSSRYLDNQQEGTQHVN